METRNRAAAGTFRVPRGRCVGSTRREPIRMDDFVRRAGGAGRGQRSLLHVACPLGAPAGSNTPPRGNRDLDHGIRAGARLASLVKRERWVHWRAGGSRPRYGSIVTVVAATGMGLDAPR